MALELFQFRAHPGQFPIDDQDFADLLGPAQEREQTRLFPLGAVQPGFQIDEPLGYVLAAGVFVLYLAQGFDLFENREELVVGDPDGHSRLLKLVNTGTGELFNKPSGALGDSPDTDCRAGNVWYLN